MGNFQDRNTVKLNDLKGLDLLVTLRINKRTLKVNMVAEFGSVLLPALFCMAIWAFGKLNYTLLKDL